MEFRIVQQRRDLIGGNGIGEVQVAVLVSGKDGGVVVAEHELKTLDLHVLSIPVVGVLDINHGLVVVPALQGEGTAGNEAGFQRPGAGVVRSGSSFHAGLLYREEGGEGSQVQHVGAGGLQGDGEGLAVFGSGDLQIIRIAGDAVEHVAVVSSGFGSGSALPGILEVLRGQGGAVGPLQAFADGEGVGQTVFADFVTGGEVRSIVAFRVIGVETAEAVGSQAGAVHGAVQRGIQLVRLRGQLQADGLVVAEIGIHKELGGISVGVVSGQAFPSHVDIVVVIDRDDGAGVHQDVFRLVHHFSTLGEVGRRLDVGDQLVVLGPVGFAAGVGQRGHATQYHHGGQQKS